METMKKVNHKGLPDAEECKSAMPAVRDALYVINGKWKLSILISIWEGNRHFGEIRRSLGRITATTLSNELKLLEINGFVKRTIYADNPLSTEYELTGYSYTLGPVIDALRDWGTMHRERIVGGMKCDTASE